MKLYKNPLQWREYLFLSNEMSQIWEPLSLPWYTFEAIHEGFRLLQLLAIYLSVQNNSVGTINAKKVLCRLLSIREF